MPKNIVVCCDGTWDKPDFQVGTNVSKLYNYLEDNNAAQVKYYDTGVGTQGPLDKITGGIAGDGLVDNIFEAYRFVCSHYCAGDELFIFGFSRGAYTARALAGVLNDAWVLQNDFTCTEDHYKNQQHNCFDVQLITESNDDYDMTIVCKNCMKLYNTINQVKEIFKTEKKNTYADYKQHRKENKGATFVVKESEQLRNKILLGLPGATAAKPSVKMIGVWDTVSAVGIPSLGDVFKTTDNLSKRILDGISNLVFKSSRNQYAFINDRLTPIVKYAYQALAVDEERNIFKPIPWDNTLSGDNIAIEQEWFIGAHANVGGGYNDHTLSDISLRWMLYRAEARGLRFDTDFTKCVHPNYFGLLHRSCKEGIYKYIPSGARILPKDKKIHDSVMKRMAGGLLYNPENIF